MWLIAKARSARSAPHERVSVRAIRRCTWCARHAGLNPAATSKMRGLLLRKWTSAKRFAAKSLKAIKVAQVSA